MKTPEELNALKEEVEALNRKLAELSKEELEALNIKSGKLSDEELKQVSGGFLFGSWSQFP